MKTYEFLNKITRKYALLRLFLTLIVLTATLLMFMYSYDTFDSALNPVEIDVTSLNSESLNRDLIYEVEFSEEFFMFDTAVFEGEDVDAYLLGAFTPEGLFVIQPSGDFDFDASTKLSGQIIHLNNDLEKVLAEEIRAGNSVLSPKFINITLVDSTKPFTNRLLIFGFLIILTIICFVGFLRSLSFKSSKLYKSMKQLGDTDAIAEEISLEADRGVLVSHKDLHIFSQYILLSSFKNNHIIKKEDLIWCYIQKTKVKQFLFITTNIVHYVLLHTKNGDIINYQLKKKDAEYVIDLLSQHHPNCVYGYSETLVDQYKNNREYFISSTESTS